MMSRAGIHREQLGRSFGYFAGVPTHDLPHTTPIPVPGRLAGHYLLIFLADAARSLFASRPACR